MHYNCLYTDANAPLLLLLSVGVDFDVFGLVRARLNALHPGKYQTKAVQR
jgi:hypothetical protein